ncbi:AraC family ethanolamine operon transcriptional activator [Lysobacter niastensis]|uniref:AraC family ethanolamine operon transcriptional activator n=1 Tax=Lysobacter niastensis TaxID=380629 RepID=A0ABU1WBN5_9GAMM|nr:AraC family transcriptional regulator [Lysobacter niastensis]MDR7135005.1 AraC family ethanolamine operon transcriptional activator [Lysobacter niastensis]
MTRTVCTFHFDEFEDAMLGLDGHYILLDRSRLHWIIDVLDLTGLAMMVGRNGAPSVYRGACLPRQYGLLVPISQFDGLKFNGNALGQCTACWMPPAEEFSVPASAGFNWLCVVVNESYVRHWVDAGLLDERATELHWGHASHPSIRRLETLVQSTMSVVANAPSDLRDALRQQLLDATLDVVRSIRPGRDPPKGRPRISRTKLLKRVLDFAEEFIDQPIRVSDFCALTEVHVATLQNVFAEQFGVSPHRYLMLLRLHAVYRAIRNADPSDTVSTICAHYGVWDLGRFASQYRQYFGIAPSKALELSLRRHQRAGSDLGPESSLSSAQLEK